MIAIFFLLLVFQFLIYIYIFILFLNDYDPIQMPSKEAIIISLLIVFFIIIILLGKRLNKYVYLPEFKHNIPDSHMFTRDKDQNLMQKRHACGAYAFLTVSNILNPQSGSVNPIRIYKRLSRLTLGKGILPIQLENLLTKNKYKIKIPQVNKLSDQKKVSILQQELANGTPIIMMINSDGPHYITLLGYDKPKDEFYVYDSYLERNPSKNYTADRNNKLPGNSTLSSQALLDLWWKGGFLGFYNYYAIIVDISKE